MARILIADDDLELLDIFKALLERAGEEVHTASDGTCAVRELAECWPELIIVDLRMPTAADGLRLIREAHSHSPAPVVVMSGWPDELYGGPEQRMVSRVLTKPVKPAELLKVVRELV